MSSTLNILRSRRRRRNEPNARSQESARAAGFGCVFIVGIFLLFIIFSFVLTYRSIVSDLPPANTIEDLLNPRDGQLLQPTRIYARDGETLVQVFAPDNAPRRYIPLSIENPQHLPTALWRATLALRDPNFWSHPGYSLEELSNPEIHPTLTQQLVADLLLWDEPPSLRRAIRERMLAAQLTNLYGRQQILEWVLNSANFGHNAYGAESAAQLYFGKSVTELTIAESATLAAASQSPALNPIDAPVASYQRRQETLYIMEELDLLDAEPADAARRSPFNLPSVNEPENPAPAFTRLILAQLESIYSRERIERGGLTIISTLDLDLQLDASCALAAQIARLNKRTVDECAAANLLPTLPTMDAVENPQASALVLDPQTGQILAAVGETNLNAASANLAPHRAGSSVTPFIYLTGFTRGLSPASLLWDIPSETGIQNFDNAFHGPLRLRTALANDYRVPVQGVLAQMGGENVTRISRSFGLNFDVLNFEDALVAPLDLASAYGVFAAAGSLNGQVVDEQLQPFAVREVRDVRGDVWLDWTVSQSQAVVTPQLAHLMTDVLSDETARWASLGTPNALEIGRPVAAKIGQVLDGREAWTVGATPQRVALVWLGADGAFSPKAAAGIWHAVMIRASEGLPADGWDAPVGITEMDVCDPSGLLPTADCPNIVREVFLNGSEPTQYDNLFRSFEINRETGFLATVFTPLELVEERKYMLVPAEARSWADAAGLPVPPTSYDAIQVPVKLPNASITKPELFADMRGEFAVIGTAGGEDFKYYRVSYGQGLNPQRWTQIGDDVYAPVQDGVLVSWNASELSGLYAVQLMVVYQNDRIEIATTQISIDNEAPTVRVLFPQDGEEIDFLKNRQIDLQVQANDNLGVDRVEYFIDFKQIGVASASPFSWTWATTAGKHSLKVVVYDRAGNSVEETLVFTVER